MALKASELTVGQSHEEVLVEDLKRTQLVMYSGASGDYNPLHTDELYTKESAGYPSVFAHGMLTMGMTGRVVTSFVGAANVRKYGVRFTNQVWPGDTLTGKATVEAVREEDGQWWVDLTVVTLNQKGEKVITGSASAVVDP
jgi:acyl dehydratase